MAEAVTTFAVLASSHLPQPVRAHAGGWDEMLLVAVPLLLFALVRWLAGRAERRRSQRDEER